MKRIICYLIGIYYFFIYGVRISGHDYVEEDDGRLRCRRCGFKDQAFAYIRIASNAIKCIYCKQIFYVEDDQIWKINHKC